MWLVSQQRLPIRRKLLCYSGRRRTTEYCQRPTARRRSNLACLGCRGRFLRQTALRDIKSPLHPSVCCRSPTQRRLLQNCCRHKSCQHHYQRFGLRHEPKPLRADHVHQGRQTRCLGLGSPLLLSTDLHYFRRSGDISGHI